MTPSWDDDGLAELEGAFQRHFPGRRPSFFVRAPGRVNLIGEHTDYNGLPVLPMALSREIRVLVSPREDVRVRIANQEEEFAPREFSISQEIPPGPPGDWANYFKASCQALARWYGEREENHAGEGAGQTGGDGRPMERFSSLRGFEAVVSSTLPVASGLSSSSALVIAAGRSLLAVNGLDMPTLEFAEEMARAEWYTGTRGGGMDQAISAGAVRGHASRIEFNPLRMFNTPVPAGWAFLVAHTLVRAEKSGTAREAYNHRTHECREALERMGGALAALGGAMVAPDRRGGGTQATGTQRDADHSGMSGVPPAGRLTYPRLLEAACLEDLLDLARSHLQGDLLKRFRHVVTEGSRVYQAEHALQHDDLPTFGLLMNSSHQSLRDDYEVSSPELNTLVELALGAGAGGARLTGAGFGGCIVALAPRRKSADILSALEEGYYRGRIPQESLTGALFRAEPAEGASVHPV